MKFRASRLLFGISVTALLTLPGALPASADEATPDNDHSVPVPGDIQQPVATSLTIQGEAGAGQAGMTVKIVKVQVDAKGNIKRATGVTSPAYELGQEVPVTPGDYLVDYSHSNIFVEVAENEHKVIELQKVNVPKINGSYTVKVFNDFTNTDMQEQRVLWTYVEGVPMTFKNAYWTTNRWGRNYDYYTRTKTKDLAQVCTESKSSLKAIGKKLCAAYLSSDYKNLIGNDFIFNSDGSYALANVTFGDNTDTWVAYETAESIKQEGREYNSSGIDGDFFSLLPGTYGLEFKNTAGKITSQLGIKLQ